MRTRKLPILVAVLVLAACDEKQSSGDNVAKTVAPVERAADRCAPPALALAGGSTLDSTLQNETRTNFTTAYKSACAKGVLKAGPLIDPGASDQGKLFLVNAPEANVASIYLSEVDGNRMMLEYPFLTTDGKTHVPTADELEEAIYCAVVGATPEEQEASGRCLPD